MKHDLSTEQIPVSAFVGSSKNLEDLKDGAVGCCMRADLFMGTSFIRNMGTSLIESTGVPHLQNNALS